MDTVIDAETLKMRELAQSLVDGEIGLSEWQMRSAQLLKALHVAMGLSAAGGLNAISASDMGFLANQIKQQYQYLNKMALQIRKGEQALDGSLVARAALYTQAGREIFYNMIARQAEQAGCTQEKSILGAADHCSGCVGEAAKGWSPIGSLIPIGQRQCLANCHCSMQYE